jgi:hypothetical protein
MTGTRVGMVLAHLHKAEVSQNGYLIEPPCPPCTSHGASMR